MILCRNVGNVSGILNSLVSKGNVRNDNGTYRFLSARAATPAASRPSSSPSSYRPSSPAPAARSSSPASYRPASPAGRVGTPSSNGAVSNDEATVLKVLSNYSGLTADRLSNLLRASGK
jgi:hypothetical protein